MDVSVPAAQLLMMAEQLSCGPNLVYWFLAFTTLLLLDDRLSELVVGRSKVLLVRATPRVTDGINLSSQEF